jgi:hypothetical protein
MDLQRKENTMDTAYRRAAELRATSFNEADNTVEVIWTTGARVRRYSWNDGPFDEELEVTPQAIRLDRLNAGAPFLDTHDGSDLSKVIGSVVPGSARVANGIGTARILLSATPGDADTIQKIRDGIIRNVSVGYRIHRVIKEETETDGSAAPRSRLGADGNFRRSDPCRCRSANPLRRYGGRCWRC